MCHNSAVVDTSVYQFSDTGSFPARGGYDLLFSVDMVKFSSSWVDGGGLGQKVLVSRMFRTKSQSVKSASHQPAFMGSCLLVKHGFPAQLVVRFS